MAREEGLRQRIALLATGGTIAGAAVNATDNVAYHAAQRGVQALVDAVPTLAAWPLQAEQVAQIDSKDMEPAVWRGIGTAHGAAALRAASARDTALLASLGRRAAGAVGAKAAVHWEGTTGGSAVVGDLLVLVLSPPTSAGVASSFGPNLRSGVTRTTARHSLTPFPPSPPRRGLPV